MYLASRLAESYYGYYQALVIFFATMLVVIAPGPGMLFVISRSLAGGRKAGIVSAIGTSTGIAVHILAAGFGLSLIIWATEIGFKIMKWKWLSAFFALLIISLAGIYHILDPENNELNEIERARLGGTYIRLSDGMTHYKLEGPDAGSIVTLVHGGTVPIWTWDKQVQALNDAGFRILSYDKYGRGYSDRPDVTYDQELYKRQLLELVDKLALKEPFDLIGLSLGGGTAVNFTAKYPDRVRKLISAHPETGVFGFALSALSI